MIPRNAVLLQRDIEAGVLAPADALEPLATIARDAPTSGLRADACHTLGAIAGRAFEAPWDVAERAAFTLLEIARHTDAPAEQVHLLHAMGRAFRNLWLMPYVHAALSHEHEDIVVAAISAAGGLAFPVLEATLANAFLDDEVSPLARGASIAALGRMGATSSAKKLVPFIERSSREAELALSALTEIRSAEGAPRAIALLADDPPRTARIAAVRYLAELGRSEVLPELRRLARHEDPELRLVAGFAARAFKAERESDADERILAALTERDRAVRASLARRLRTLPAGDVLARASVLLGDDPAGIVQIVAEVRAPEVTRFLLAIATDERFDPIVRARAVGAVEADEPWEQESLAALATSTAATEVRVSATQTIGAFAPSAFTLDRLSPLADDRSPKIRAALLWALQLTTRPGGLEGKERARAESIVRRALEDPESFVRRRAAYVAGNLDATALVADLAELARDPSADLRIAAFTALGDIGAGERIADLVHLWNREDDPEALAAASRCIDRTFDSGPNSTRDGDEAPPPASLERARDRLPKLLASSDARLRASALRVAGRSPGAIAAGTIAKLVDDPSPRVRNAAVHALGRVAGPPEEPILVRALADPDPAIEERAGMALLALGTASALAEVVDFVARASDRSLARRVAAHLRAPSSEDGDAFVKRISAGLERVDHDDPVYELLLALKVRSLEASLQVRARPSAPPLSLDAVDRDVIASFPSWTRLVSLRGFAPLARSLRTAEALFGASTPDADLSPSIVLWTKCLEGYLHAWLAPRLAELQARPAALWEVTDRMLGPGWAQYQRWIGDRWKDPVVVGGISVEVPLRHVANVLRDFQERRRRPLDSPASVTEWSRLMVFLAIDHASGAKNLLRVRGNAPEHTLDVAHRLHVLAQVRNLVTHRQVAERATLAAFRALYYSTFEAISKMA